jgi:hypothetical protein
MDHISFQVRKSHLEDYKVVEPVINGKVLRQWLQRIEAPALQAEAQPTLAGCYEGLPPLLVLPPKPHFWGQAQAAYRHGSLITLLEYGLSGVPGDWTFAAHITVEAQWVHWQGFTQLKRPDWSYAELGRLTFDQDQYRTALQAAAAEAY